jgi:hypothetical protein
VWIRSNEQEEYIFGIALDGAGHVFVEKIALIYMDEELLYNRRGVTI